MSGGHYHSDLPGPVLWKPFLPSDLITVVRRLLDYCSEENRAELIC